MAKETLGRNITFPIYNENGTPFHNLVLHKATYDSVVMSLGDKISGEVYYKDNMLDVTNNEYIEYKQNPNDASEQPVKYILVNPPTIIREGLVKDNGEMKGMTKYSFEFYHPMYRLANIPFGDVAVSYDENQFKSQDKKFFWIGYLQDFIDKISKNLQNTDWIISLNSNVPSTKSHVLSEVLSFDNNSISVEEGSRVERGQLLFTYASSASTEITIPEDGIITDIQANVGQSVQQDQVLATLAVPNSIRIEFSAAENMIYLLNPGDTLSYLRADDPTDTPRKATISGISRTANGDTYTVYLIPEENDLPIGMSITVINETMH